MAQLLSEVHWPGLNRYKQFSMTRSLGTSPDTGSFTVGAAFQNPDRVGTLRIVQNGVEIVMPECRIAKVTAPRQSERILQIQDGRWKWEHVLISGEYNIPDRQDPGKALKNTERTVRDLVGLLVVALNINCDLGLVPLVRGPYVRWDRDQVGPELDRLLARYGLALAYKLDNTFEIVLLGSGEPPPEKNLTSAPKFGVDVVARPERVRVITDNILFQRWFALRPIGYDTEFMLSRTEPPVWKPLEECDWIGSRSHDATDRKYAICASLTDPEAMHSIINDLPQNDDLDENTKRIQSGVKRLNFRQWEVSAMMSTDFEPSTALHSVFLADNVVGSNDHNSQRVVAIHGSDGKTESPGDDDSVVFRGHSLYRKGGNEWQDVTVLAWYYDGIAGEYVLNELSEDRFRWHPRQKRLSTSVPFYLEEFFFGVGQVSDLYPYYPIGGDDSLLIDVAGEPYQVSKRFDITTPPENVLSRQRDGSPLPPGTQVAIQQSGFYRPAEIYIRVAFTARHPQSRTPYRYETTFDAGGEDYNEEQLFAPWLQARYDSDPSQHIPVNRDMHRLSEEFADERIKEYAETEPTARYSYGGIRAIDCNGLVRQVTWSAGGAASSTEVSVNSEHRGGVHSYRQKVERSQAKKLVLAGDKNGPAA